MQGAIPLFSDIYINVRRPAHGTGANDRDDSPETIVGIIRTSYADDPKRVTDSLTFGFR
ncbi:hypothetical protein [Cohnella boryungensis]|uniref:Uncharacterized protein n=1 Tax=Cohnella boryungensis TaxID=768479 RepID=A0ABV8SE92_9BACL